MAEAEEVPLETKATEMSEMGTLIENTDLETWKAPKNVWSYMLNDIQQFPEDKM